MSDVPPPSRVEELSREQGMARLRGMGAKYVPDKSTPTRHVYWSQQFGTWVLATSRRGNMVLGYYPMEDCPCNKA